MNKNHERKLLFLRKEIRLKVEHDNLFDLEIFEGENGWGGGGGGEEEEEGRKERVWEENDDDDKEKNKNSRKSF